MYLLVDEYSIENTSECENDVAVAVLFVSDLLLRHIDIYGKSNQNESMKGARTCNSFL